MAPRPLRLPHHPTSQLTAPQSGSGVPPLINRAHRVRPSAPLPTSLSQHVPLSEHAFFTSHFSLLTSHFSLLLRVDLLQLSKSYGRTLVLSNVSTSLPPATLTAVLGINGAGKTTLLRTLSGLSSPDSGEIHFDGQPLSHGRLDLRRRVLFLPDNPPVFPGTDILENVAAHLHLWQADQPGIESKVASWLDDLGLTNQAGQSCASLSRGQRWKASLLALLAVDPDLWLLDEPFASGMDTRGLSVFRREAIAATARGRTVLYTTQIPELAASFADAVALVGHHSIQILDPDRDFARDPHRLESLILAAGTP